MLYLGADHRGYNLKEKIKDWLLSQNQVFEDLGIFQPDLEDDYPDFGEKVGRAVSTSLEGKRGIALCGSGAGICVAANKIRGIRAALAVSPEMARVIRNDDDINILCLASDFTDEETAIRIVEIFLKTPFGGQERHKRRIEKIKNLEK